LSPEERDCARNEDFRVNQSKEHERPRLIAGQIPTGNSQVDGIGQTTVPEGKKIFLQSTGGPP